MKIEDMNVKEAIFYTVGVVMELYENEEFVDTALQNKEAAWKGIYDLVISCIEVVDEEGRELLDAAIVEIESDDTGSNVQ